MANALNVEELEQNTNEKTEPQLETEFVYRAARNKVWHEQRVMAFFMRRNSDRNGLSIITRGDCVNGEICRAIHLNKCYGELVLRASDIEAIDGLSIEINDVTTFHANIKGIPYEDEDAARANRLATLLSEIVIRSEEKRFKRTPTN